MAHCAPIVIGIVIHYHVLCLFYHDDCAKVAKYGRGQRLSAYLSLMGFPSNTTTDMDPLVQGGRLHTKWSSWGCGFFRFVPLLQSQAYYIPDHPFPDVALSLTCLVPLARQLGFEYTTLALDIRIGNILESQRRHPLSHVVVSPSLNA